MIESPKFSSNNATALTSPTKFSAQAEKVSKAYSILTEAVNHVENQFAPVLGPSCPRSSGDQKQTPPLSDFDGFVANTCDCMHGIAARLNDFCERSSI
jgi:hypothetical protein